MGHINPSPVQNGTYAPAAQGVSVSPFQQVGNWFAPALANSVSRTLALNDAWAAPLFIGTAMTVDQIAVSLNTIGGAGSVVRLGIYADNGSGYPGALVADGGTVAVAATTGTKTVTGMTAALQPGLYWVVMVCQVAGSPILVAGAGGAIQFGGANNEPAGSLAGAGGLLVAGSTITGALPGTFPAGGIVAGNVPYPAVHRSA